MLLLDRRVRAKPANTRFPPSHRPRVLSMHRERRHHCNLSDTHRNQYHNVNLRGLQRPNLSYRESPPRIRESPPSSPPFSGLSLPSDPLLGTIQCPLNSPEFPPVTEADHHIGRCYCYLCTCEEHMCPNKKRRKQLFDQTAVPSKLSQVEFLSKRLDFLTLTTSLQKPMTGSSTTSRRYKPNSQLTGWEGEGHELRLSGRSRGQARHSSETWEALNKTDFGVPSGPTEDSFHSNVRYMTISIRKHTRDWPATTVPPRPTGLRASMG